MVRIATYHGDDIGLEGLVQRDKTEVEDEVELGMGSVSLAGSLLIWELLAGLATYGGDKEEHRDGLLSARHDESRQRKSHRKRIKERQLDLIQILNWQGALEFGVDEDANLGLARRRNLLTSHYETSRYGQT